MTKCNICTERNIIKAYRTICDKCAQAKTDKGEKQKLCTKCGKNTLAEGGTGYVDAVSRKAKAEAKTKLENDMEEVLKNLKERCKRTVLRKIETEEVTYDPVKKIFVYKDTEEEYKVGERRPGDDSDSDLDDSDDDSEDEIKDKKKKEPLSNLEESK